MYVEILMYLPNSGSGGLAVGTVGVVVDAMGIVTSAA